MEDMCKTHSVQARVSACEGGGGVELSDGLPDHAAGGMEESQWRGERRHQHSSTSAGLLAHAWQPDGATAIRTAHSRRVACRSCDHKACVRLACLRWDTEANNLAVRKHGRWSAASFVCLPGNSRLLWSSLTIGLSASWLR